MRRGALGAMSFVGLGQTINECGTDRSVLPRAARECAAEGDRGSQQSVDTNYRQFRSVRQTEFCVRFAVNNGVLKQFR